MKITFAILILSLAGSGFSQISLRGGPRINGIALGATREEIIGKLGKPISETRRDAGECVGGTEMTLRYPGLKFVLWDDAENPRKFTVGEFEVTSARWNVSGARIGNTDKQIRSRFGRPDSRGTEPAKKLPVWYYSMDEDKGPGNTNFEFRSGKLVRILSLWLMC